MKNTELNGWANYATWRVFNDNLAGVDFDYRVTPQSLKEIVYDLVFSNFEMQEGSHFVEEYAELYINLVDYEDIAETINNDIR